jgi:RNA polymerase sigma-70 factor (ECF subfamily)
MEALSVVGVPREEPVSFDEIYEDWFHTIERWSYALGCPKADLGDVAQEVFLVVRRKLEQFDGNNLSGWLYRITARKVKDHRRRAWFRGLFFGHVQEPIDVADSPEQDYERQQRRAALRRVLDQMSEKRRDTFILYELEGYSGQEVAELLEIPVQTVWTRLHHARKEFFRIVAAERRRGRLP